MFREGASETTREGLGLTHIVVVQVFNLQSQTAKSALQLGREWIVGQDGQVVGLFALRNQKQMEPLRDERLHKETPHRATDCSDQTGCRLKDESTTPPYQRRPGTASGTSAVLWPPTAALPSVRQESSHGWGHVQCLGSRTWG
jgi:hypothetical protein